MTFFVGAFLWWVTTNHGGKEEEQSQHEWRILSAQVGDTVHDQLGFSAYAAPDEKVRQPILGAKVGQQLAEWQEAQDCSEALRKWMSATDHRRSAAVRLGGQPKRLSSQRSTGWRYRSCIRSSIWECSKCVCVVAGDEELTLHGNDSGTQQPFIKKTTKIQANKWEPPFGEDDWAAIGQALYQSGAWRVLLSTVLQLAKCKGTKKGGRTSCQFTKIGDAWRGRARAGPGDTKKQRTRATPRCLGQGHTTRSAILWERETIGRACLVEEPWRQKQPETGNCVFFNDPRLSISCRLNVNGCACSEFVSSLMNHYSHVPLACRTRTVKQNREERSTQCLRYEMFAARSAAQAL